MPCSVSRRAATTNTRMLQTYSIITEPSQVSALLMRAFSIYIVMEGLQRVYRVSAVFARSSVPSNGTVPEPRSTQQQCQCPLDFL